MKQSSHSLQEVALTHRIKVPHSLWDESSRSLRDVVISHYKTSSHFLQNIGLSRYEREFALITKTRILIHRMKRFFAHCEEEPPLMQGGVLIHDKTRLSLITRQSF